MSLITFLLSSKIQFSISFPLKKIYEHFITGLCSQCFLQLNNYRNIKIHFFFLSDFMKRLYSKY